MTEALVITSGAPADAARNEPRGGAPLGKNADFASASDGEALAKVGGLDPKPLSALTVQGWYLRSVGRELLRKSGYGFRLASCGAKISKAERGVTVFRRPDRAYGRIGGVCVCGQSVVCPVCAPRIAAFRAAEVEQAYARARDAGFEARLDTFTMPHWAGSPLGEEIDTFGKAWRQFTGGRVAAQHRFGYLGNHTAREITWGDLNGWHYHHHQLRYVRPGTHEPELLRASWLGCLQAVDRFSDGVEEHAFLSEPVTDERGASYTAKLANSVDAQALACGLEIAGSSMKGRNIVRLLGDYSRGDDQAGQVWLHGVREVCTRKVSSVRWSPGLREKVGLTQEKTDQEIAQEKAERSDEYLGELTASQWRTVLRNRGEFELVAAAQDGVEAVDQFLSRIGAGQLHPEGLPDFTARGGRQVP
jgi:hypothetical protein